MSSKNTRRTFIKGLLTGMVAASTTMILRRTSAQTSDVRSLMPSAKKQGYHQSRHIQAYYSKINF